MSEHAKLGLRRPGARRLEHVQVGRARPLRHDGRRGLGLLHPGLRRDAAVRADAARPVGAMKFAIVVMFYMHLKYDHKLFRALFTGPLIIAVLDPHRAAVPLRKARGRTRSERSAGPMIAAALLHPLAPNGLGFTVHASTVIGIAALAALYVWRARKGPAGRPHHRPARGLRLGARRAVPLAQRPAARPQRHAICSPPT